MPAFSSRMYGADDVKRWEKLEAKDKLGPKQKILLDYWRKTLATYPTLKQIASSGGKCFIWRLH